MGVRAKFKVTKVEAADWGGEHGKVFQIELFPVGGAAGGESAENKAFYAATPGGYLTLSLVRADAAAAFAEGAEYYVDFTRVDQSEDVATKPAEIGSVVHFVYGTQHVPAIITDPAFVVPEGATELIGQAMTVFPVGQTPFNAVAIHDAEGRGGTWHWPE